MKPHIAGAMLLLFCLVLVGCEFDSRAAIESAERAATFAQTSLAAAENAVNTAEQAVALARSVQQQFDSEEARSAVEIAERVLAEARAAIPAAQDLADKTQLALAEAKESEAKGEGLWAIIIGLGTALVPAVGAAVAKWREARKNYEAVKAAVSYSTRIESGEGSTVVRLEEKAKQEKANVRSIIKKALAER